MKVRKQVMAGRKSLEIVSQEAEKRDADCPENSRLFSDRYKRVRECLALCRFAELYRRLGYKPDLNFVEGDGDPQRVPDFTLYSGESDVTPACEIEITEILEPGRRRHDYYRFGPMSSDNPEPGPDYMTKLVDHVGGELGKKFAKSYPSGSWLVLYFQPEKLIYWRLRGTDKEFVDQVMGQALKNQTVRRGISELWVLLNPPLDYILRYRVA